MNQNIAARIINPLAGISGEQLEADVDHFCQTRGLNDKRDHFLKGAFLAQNPKGFESQHNLTAEDKDVIRYENAHKWSHPKLLYLTIALCSIGAATQGWDQTGSNGANLSFPTEFGIPEDDPVNADRNTWLVGLVNSAPYIGSAFLGCWLSDPINNYLGRRGCILITAIILIVTPICSGLTQNWQQLFVVRLILGFGMGAKGATSPSSLLKTLPLKSVGPWSWVGNSGQLLVSSWEPRQTLFSRMSDALPGDCNWVPPSCQPSSFWQSMSAQNHLDGS